MRKHRLGAGVRWIPSQYTPSEVQELFLSLQKAVIERTGAAEMNLHLGYRPGGDKPEGQTNERNGASGKTVLTEHGPVRVERPRDRDGSFTPILIPKHERRFTGFASGTESIF